MKNTSRTIIFFGNERLVSGLESTDTPILRGLIEQGYSIAAVVSHHSETSSRKKRPLEVADIANAHNIPILLPDRPIDIYDQLVSFGAEAAVLSAYGRIIPQKVIDIFPKGIINIHPSLLPLHRGPTPIESAIAKGEAETGVSIMQLSAKMDAGPIYGQVSLSLEGTETKFELYESLSGIGSELLLSLLPGILDGSTTPKPQDDSRATYDNILSKSDAWLDFSALSAIEAERLVRAYLVFPKTKARIFEQDIIITKAHVSEEKITALDIECSQGILSIDRLIGPSGREMSAKDFLNGYAAS